MDTNQRRPTQRKRNMIFGCWNIQGLNTKCTEIFRAIQEYDLDIAVISETKKKGKGNEVKGEYTHFYSGVSKDRRAKAGVSIVIKNKLQKFIQNWEAINERLITVDLNLWDHKMQIIGVYAPTDDAKVEEKDEFFEHLTLLLNKVGRNKEVVLMGDFNGRVGHKIDSKCIGYHGENKVNDNGERLLEVCEEYKLKILNGFFKHKNIHKYTWTQPTKGLKSIIDYIIIRRSSDIHFDDVRVQRGASCGSDHHLVRGKGHIMFNTARHLHINQNYPLPEAPKIPRYNLDSLKDPSIVFLYKLRLAAKMNQIPTGNIENGYNWFKKKVHEAANEALGQKTEIKKGRREEPWWTNEIETLIEEKKKTFHKWLSTGDIEDKKIYNRYKYEVKKQIQKAKNTYWQQKCDEIDRCIGGSRSRQAWKTLKTLKTNETEKRRIDPIGIENWKTYFENMLTEKREKFTNSIYELNAVQSVEEEITIEEVIAATRKMKTNKSAGPGGLPIELIKYAPLQAIEQLTKIFNRCLIECNIPEEWRLGHISAIYKKGNKLDCDNYRGISVTSSIGRLYGRIIKNRIEDELQEEEDQSGFRPGRSCIDNIFCLKQLSEKYIAHGRELHLIFIDLKKAYDTVPIIKLWQAMENKNISTNYINVIKNWYKGNKSKIKIGNQMSQEFRTNKGLRQGCCISPTLFKIFIDKTLKNWKRKCAPMGVQLEEDTIHSLLFADDQVILAEDRDDAEYMFRKLIEEYAYGGLEINTSKTQYMVVGGNGQDLITEYGRIKCTDEYKYLGVTITRDGRDSTDIKNKVARGKTVVKQLHGVLWNDDISIQTKHRMYKTFVESSVTYGAEVWTMDKKTKSKINSVEMMYWRRCCKQTLLDRVRNEDIRAKMQVPTTILDEIEKKQLWWYGHMRRMGEERLPKKVWNWRPHTRKKKGRPRRSWNLEINEAMHKRGLNDDMVNDRRAWAIGCGKRLL